MTEKKRLYNLDLLRIIAMMMIVTLHFLRWGAILTRLTPLSWQYNVAWIVDGLCIVAVNCYILISGYFLVEQKFNFSKIPALIGEVLFYSVGIYILLLVSGKVPFSVRGTLESFLPVLTNEYWFVTAYIGMYVLSPFINRLIKSLNKKEHFNLIIILFILFCLWPTLFFWGYDDLAGYKLSLGYSVSWFLVLYIVAAFIREYYNPDYNTKRHIAEYLMSYAVVIACFLSSAYLFSVSNKKIFNDMFNCFMAYNSVPVFLSSLALFILFLNIKVRSKRLICSIGFFAPLTFGVYLIHQQRPFDSLLWSRLHVVDYVDSPYFILLAVGVIFCIYFICSIADYLRIKLFRHIGRDILGFLHGKLERHIRKS